MKPNKTFARSILALYVFITVTFPLAHRDYVPLQTRLVFSATGSSSDALDAGAEEITCPAHQFAQSTTSTAASSEEVFVEIAFFFLQVNEQIDKFVQPTKSYSARAPPQA